MRLYSSDEARSVDVGTGSIWYSIYSTVMVAFSEDIKRDHKLAIDFLRDGECSASNAEIVLKQIKAIQSGLSDLAPEKAIYDLHKPDVPPPWKGNIAKTVTSCANLYTTADGKDLFTEVISLLEHAVQSKTDINAG